MEALSPALARAIDMKTRNKIGKEYQKECETILAANAVEWYVIFTIFYVNFIKQQATVRLNSQVAACAIFSDTS